MKKRLYQIFISFLIIFALCWLVDARAQSRTKQIAVKNGTVTILVTAMPHNQKQREIVAKLQNTDFDVMENKRSQKIISVKNATEAPINLAVVVQDNLDWRVNNEIKTLKEFIRGLPDGSRVMTAYITIGGAIVTQELTTDRKQAADSLRIIRGSSFPLNFSPFDGIRTVLKHFDETATGRRMILVVSDGLDLSLGYRNASPFLSISLDKAIRDAQRLGVAVFTIYAPSEDRRPFGRFGRNYGQSSLIRLSDETGGESFATGVDLVTFDPYLEDFKEMFSRQWLITYRSSTVEKGFRRIDVKTDFDIHLYHLPGYEPKK